MIEMPTFTALSALCSGLTTPSRYVDGLIFRKLHEQSGDVWTDVFDDGVWHRRDPEDHAAWDSPMPYTASFDIANAMRMPQMRLASLRELIRTDGSAGDPAWRPWACTLSVPSLNLEVEGQGCNPATTVMDAILQVHAHLNEEKQG